MKWNYLKFGVSLLNFILGFFYVGGNASESAPQITSIDVLMMTFLMPFALVFVIGIQYFNSLSEKIWEIPSWFVNPFNLKQPLQFFHFLTFILIAFGLSSSLSLFWNGFNHVPEAIMPLALGCGLLAGLHICIYIFNKKITDGKTHKEIYRIF
ncbi:MAG: hypothetical protein MI799_08470 [Desulfobacterales bacterium]|nr:hypothetical protein [Desulfobacterales bacterium]